VGGSRVLTGNPAWECLAVNPYTKQREVEQSIGRVAAQDLLTTAMLCNIVSIF
jgi:hypothetical protein